MEKMYGSIHLTTASEKEELWKTWLWETDCNALPSDKCCNMNKMHVLGIMCCLLEALNPVPEFNAQVCNIIPELPIIHLHTKPICEFSLRELIDQIECMQLNWGQVIAEGIENSLLLVKACMARLGQIAHHAYPTDGFVLDDPQHTTPLPVSNSELTLSIISRKSLRQTICLCFSLLRVQDIIARSRKVPEPSDLEVKRVIKALKIHHLESSMDFFNLLQQMVYLAPGMRLGYRTNFAGMYNDVSQVVYFHYPRFCRLAQISLNEIPSKPNNMLPLISQLIPDISTAYEDDSQIPGITSGDIAANADVKWVWLVCCGEIFLIETEKGLIWASENDSLASLVAYFLRSCGRNVGGVGEDYNNCEDFGGGGGGDAQEGEEEDIFTAHGHLRLV
jgi:hypothetical protein